MPEMTNQQALDALFQMADNAVTNGRDHRLKDQAYQQLTEALKPEDSEAEDGNDTG